MNSISAEMNEPVNKALYLNSDVISNDLKVMEVQQESPLSDTSSNNQCDEGSNNITKEKNVPIQDLSNNSGSGNFTNTEDCINQEKPEQSQDCNNSNCESQIPCYKGQENVEVALAEAMTSVEEAMCQEKVLEPLDLRLPKKNKENDKCKWLLDPGNSVSLIMEVDEIDDDTQYVETGENEDDHTDSFDLDDWDQHPSVAMSPTYESSMSPDLKDTLLIDVEGIPYILTPDGQKIPQIDLGSSEFDLTRSLGVEDADSDQEVFLPNLTLGSLPEEEKNVESKSAEDQAGQTTLPPLSRFSSLPVQIGASNTDSSTPILLLSPSQLQALKASNSNPGVLTLSLPLTPAPSIQSPPVFLVLSSQTPSEPQTKMPSISPVALSSSSGLLDSKSEPVSCTTATDRLLSGQNNPCNLASSPTSPTSSSTFSNLANQLKTEACSDTPTSFREALLRLAVSAEQKNVNQPKCNEESLAFNHSSCPEATQAEGEHHNTDGSQVSEQTFISVDKTDSSLKPIFPKDHPLQSSTSPVHPESALLPEGQDSQALGPRRILYCQYCPRIFYFLSDLERHSITHSQKKPHVCQWCGKAFKRSSHLERHKHIHTGERNFECQLCPRRFREAAELTRHQRVHTGEKPFQCLLCHMRFAERNTLRRHTKRKHQGQHHEAMNGKRKAKTEGMPEQEEENAEWYSSAVAEMESDNDTGGE
ncbi:PR domain zinc finger protein 1 [Trichomycterus rosablanca]|uniref:PR domain zinc finger protein 1 n=1 Tax=Trichomycterus rosablanca TaxID=2290929 RepID=UPI002F3582D5